MRQARERRRTDRESCVSVFVWRKQEFCPWCAAVRMDPKPKRMEADEVSVWLVPEEELEQPEGDSR